MGRVLWLEKVQNVINVRGYVEQLAAVHNFGLPRLTALCNTRTTVKVKHGENNGNNNNHCCHRIAKLDEGPFEGSAFGDVKISSFF